MLNQILPLYLFPLAGCLILCLPVRFSEKFITRLTGFSLFVPAIVTVVLVIYKINLGLLPVERRVISLNLYGHKFDLIFWIDHFSILLMFLTHLLGLLVVKYSHGYLHMEKGYQRFFSTTLFFIFGMYLISLAGTIDIFFAGWEVVGFSSFFLIAFYRSHVRSVLNAWRIYNIYRICDVGLLMGAVLGHVLWNEATRFSQLASLSPGHFQDVSSGMIFILSFFLILASLGKSAQFPFHVWPSKAMEGPTPSSAIFYGALSIHAGVFLLIRTYSIWSFMWEMRVLVAIIGILTCLFSTLQGRVQSNIKGQIAFASTAQIGIMFVELSLGFVTFAMIHLFFHALFRCFQLLVSTSVVANSLTINNKVIEDRIKKRKRWEINFFSERINKTLYTLAMNDFFMDPSWRGFRFLPWVKLHSVLKSLVSHPLSVLIFILVFTSALTLKFDYPVTMALIFSSLSLFFSMRALFYEKDPFFSFLDLSLSLMLDMLGMYLIDPHSIEAIQIFMMSVFPALITGIIVLKNYRSFDLQDFHAMGTKHPVHANLFLIVFMILSGMPVSTAFFGEDLILEEMLKNSLIMASLTTLSLMLNGLICVRIYTRIFMGKSSFIANDS